MKKFIAVLGVICILSGLKLMGRGLENIKRAGDALYEYPGGYQRLDSEGGIKKAKQDFNELGAKIIFTEELTDEGITVIYGFSPYITKYETVNGKKINVMAAVTKENKVSYGVPMLTGSY